MKKLFILLGLLMFSLLGCSCEKPKPVHQHYFIEGICECGEEDSNYEPPHEHEFINGKCSCGEKVFVEIKYKEFEFSDYLNYCSRTENNAACWDIVPPIDLEILPQRLVNSTVYFVTLGEKTRDYYICGYVSKKVNDEIVEAYRDIGACAGFSKWFSGDKGYYLGYTIAAYFDYFDATEYPIIWYEIPEGEEIPFEINDMFLIIIAETRMVTYESIDSSFKYEIELLYENKSYYNNESNEEDSYRKTLKTLESIQVLQNNAQTYIEIGLIMPQTFLSVWTSFGFPIMNIDGVKYVNVGDYTTMYNGEDLKEKHEYILDKSGNVLFKLEDILYVFEKGE